MRGRGETAAAAGQQYNLLEDQLPKGMLRPDFLPARGKLHQGFEQLQQEYAIRSGKSYEEGSKDRPSKTDQDMTTDWTDRIRGLTNWRKG